jgi:phosphotransferase system  glucose/maltose/N-acetylglucosamine-specific IIC component
MIAFANGHEEKAKAFLDNVEEAIIFPLMTLMVAVALLMFLWGGYEYVMNASDEGGRETGRRHMLYGVIGMLVMISAYAILKIAAGTFGIDDF